MPLRNWRGDAVLNKVGDWMERGMKIVTIDIEATIKRKLGTSSSPSAPGDPPGRVTGVLQGGVTSFVERKGLNIMGYVGVADVVYAKFLEYGTYKMAARPFIRPSIAEKKGDIIKTLSRA